MPETMIRPAPHPALPVAPYGPPRPSAVVTPARRRDARIDVLRGIALVMIFINHIPGTIFELATSRNFGFSDAAEGFVFLSGLSAALAYAGGMAVRPLWPGIRKIWRRAWTLYLVHLMITFWTIAIVAAALKYGGTDALISTDNFQHLLKDPLGVLVGLPTLGHQFGYVNILPMYAALLLVTPALLLVAMRWPRATMAGAFAVWLAAGILHFDLPNLPLPGGWFFNPFAWQLLFTLGLLTGLAMKRGERLVPARLDLALVSGAFLVFSLVWLKWPTLGNAGNATLGWVAAQGVPGVIRDFDKTYVSVPRLLHFLALAYFLSALPGFRTFCEAKVFAPLALLGRQALPVFALGTILSFTVRAIREVSGIEATAFDAALMVAGIATMLAFAAILEASRRAALAPVRPA